MDRASDEELQFSKYYFEFADKVLKRSSIIQKEFCLYPAFRVFQMQNGDSDGDSTYKQFGRIDFVIKYKGHTYVVEVKFSPFASKEFWEAIKVVGYTEYFMFQTGMKDIRPAIFMPITSIKLEHQYICGRLKITLFGIIKNKDKSYTVIPMGDKPYYQITGKK